MPVARRPHRRFVAGILGFVLLGLAGCGDDSPDEMMTSSTMADDMMTSSTMADDMMTSSTMADDMMTTTTSG